LVSKPTVRDSGGLEILTPLRISDGKEPLGLSTVGLSEAAFGVLMLALPRARWPFALTVFALPALSAGARWKRRDILQNPLNRASLTIAKMALALVGCWVTKGVPTAVNCRRDPAEQEV
jgi:hypothetical protein